MANACARPIHVWGTNNAKCIKIHETHIYYTYTHIITCIHTHTLRRVFANYFHCISTRASLSTIMCACTLLPYIRIKRIYEHKKKKSFSLYYFCVVFIPFNGFFPGYRGEQKKITKKRTRAPNLHGRAINFNLFYCPRDFVKNVKHTSRTHTRDTNYIYNSINARIHTYKYKTTTKSTLPLSSGGTLSSGPVTFTSFASNGP